jgi:hypothetical protein
MCKIKPLFGEKSFQIISLHLGHTVVDIFYSL